MKKQGCTITDSAILIWMTSDLAIYDYMSQSKNGEGGIYNITNLNLYHYAGNNPVKYVDPNGREDEDLRELTDVEREYVVDAFFTAFLNIGELQDDYSAEIEPVLRKEHRRAIR